MILYELLAGRPPYDGASEQEVVDAIRAGQPRLPVEIDPRIPEPLQAIALKAMERDPALRYRPRRTWRSTCGGSSTAVRCWRARRFTRRRSAAAPPPHLQHIDEWLQLRLIHPHEAERLRRAYRALDARDEDWIVESRALSYTQIALYLGAFLLVCGSLFYFVANRWYHAVEGIARPLAVLGLPFIGLNLAARHLYRRDHKAVAVAFYLAAVALLPLLLMILFDETGFLVAPRRRAEPAVSRRLGLEPAAAGHDARRVPVVRRPRAVDPDDGAQHGVRDAGVRASALSVAADFGLRSWIEDGRWDLLALHLSPLVGDLRRPWRGGRTRGARLVEPAALPGGALLLIVVAGAARAERPDVPLPRALAPGVAAGRRSAIRTLLDTVAAMTLNGVAVLRDRRRARAGAGRS